MFWVLLCVPLLVACPPATRSLQTYCDPEHFVRIDIPAGWIAERIVDRRSVNVRLRPREDAATAETDAAEFVITITPGTEDGEKLGTADNQLGMVLGLGSANVEVRPFELSHPVYDSSSAITDDGISIVHIVWMVLQEADYLQIIAAATSQEEAPGRAARLKSIVDSIVYRPDDCRPKDPEV